MTGVDGVVQNQRGRYKCLFCNHKTWKILSAGIAHVDSQHPLELAQAKAEALQVELERERSKPPKIEIREKIVYRDPPKPTEKKKEYWYVRNYGMEGIYCTTCKQVQTGVGIPVGQTIENTPHSCGNRTLLPVVEVR